VQEYKESQEFQTFKDKVLAMDNEKLETEIAFQDKCIFFTDRAAKREIGEDRTMRNQLERMKVQREFMGAVMAARPVKKAKRDRKKRR